jgi:cobalt/nickel transport system ATP-binding protein
MELFTDRLVYRFDGRERKALDDVSLRFPQGQRIALMGPNGSGKTTLILHLNGVIKPQKGRVTIRENGNGNGNGNGNEKSPPVLLRQNVGIVFQNPDDQLFSASAAQDIGFGPFNLGLSREEVEIRVEEVADLCRVSHLLTCPVHALSAGEKARVALAGVLAMRPSYLIVDETVSSLDPWMRAEILDIFDGLVDSGKTVILVTHEVQFARTWAERLILMNEGRVAFDGDPHTGIDRYFPVFNRKERTWYPKS